MSGTPPPYAEPPPFAWQLRVELLEVTPKVWRRLLVPPEIRLPTLHQVFQAALGWTDSHLHEFVIAGKRYAIYDPEFAAELKQRDERRIVLEKALGHEARCFDYLYDFGDSWHHVVILEDPHARSDPHGLIWCLEGENACPPEDVGGPHGYHEFLEVLADPSHEDYEQFNTWSGGNFDSKRFDRDVVNSALLKIKR